MVRVMPINIRWFDDTKRIILWEIIGSWTLDEMHKIYSEGNGMCAQVPENTINALIDMTRSNSIPSNIFSALSARTRTETPNYDMAVIVSNNRMVKGFVNVFNTIPVLRGQFVVVSTLGQALSFIEKRRSERESTQA